MFCSGGTPPWPSSPPTRGCSVRERGAVGADAVFPADAGVPAQPASVEMLAWSSSPTRGCSGGPPGPDDCGAVLPADAGVFRSKPGQAGRQAALKGFGELDAPLTVRSLTRCGRAV